MLLTDTHAIRWLSYMRMAGQYYHCSLRFGKNFHGAHNRSTRRQFLGALVCY
jgi:hypothetical protein